MFSSRNDDEKVAKRRVWPWGRRDEQDQAEETVEQPSESFKDASGSSENLSEATSESKVAIDVVQTADTSKQEASSHSDEHIDRASAAEETEGKLGLFARMRQKFEKQADKSVPVESRTGATAATEQAIAAQDLDQIIDKPESISGADVQKAQAEEAELSKQSESAVQQSQSKPETVPDPAPVAEVVDSHTTESTPSDAVTQKQPAKQLEPAAAEPRVSKQPSQQQDPQIKTGDVGVFDTPVAGTADGEESPEISGGGFFAKMRKGLNKTRNVLVEGVTELFIGKKEIDDELLEELETQLLVSDVGVEATAEIIGKLTERVKYRELDDADALIGALKTELSAILQPADKPLIISEKKKPYVILVVGVNGVGKTTTIGKLASRLQKQNKSVMLAAGDTFRAAAVEQLQVWGERNKIPVVAQHTGADSASVVYDAFEAAKARGVDVLIADTAGRLHNKEHLMEELKKVRRVLGKLDAEAPHEVLLVMDAGTGQNALSQAKLFHESMGLTGMALTKLDGTAKGGVIFALSRQMQLPIRFLGVGEQIDDLRPFVASEFVDALFDRSQ